MTEAQPTPGVGAVVIEDGMLLLIQRGRGAYIDRWAVPGGRQRRGETMREAAARETLEVGDVVWAGDIMDDDLPPTYHYTVVDFLATRIGGYLEAGDDAAAVRWVPVDEIRSRSLTPTMYELLDRLGL